MPNFFDRLISSILLLLLLPIFIVITIIIKLTDPGPILYVAVRVGLNGNPFKMYKFRSMRVRSNCDEQGPVITAKNDARITKFGKLLRSTKLDELPQLFNVLKGDMAIIGPRPEDFDIVIGSYNKKMMDSLKVRPGLASPGSIYNYTHIECLLPAGDPTSFYTRTILVKKVLMDAYYANNKSVLYDLRLIFRTIKVISLKLVGVDKFSDPPELFYINSSNME